MPPLIAMALLLASAAPPDWNKAQLRTMLARVQGAGRAPTLEAQDTELAEVGGMAYSVARNQHEANEQYAKRVLMKRDPEHPNVKKGQWLSALMRTFYIDVGARCALLARFETNTDDRRYLEKMANDAKGASAQIASTLQLTIEGLEGFGEPLPVAAGEAPEMRGATVTVHQGGKVTIENIDRVTFVGHQPPENVARTGRGAIKEVYSAQKQYNVSAQMLGQYDPMMRKNRGHLRVVIPSSYPALYLNEICRGGLEAEMKTLHLMTMTKRGELRELEIPIQWGMKTKAKKGVVVACTNEMTMQECASKIVHAQSVGKAAYGIE